MHNDYHISMQIEDNPNPYAYQHACGEFADECMDGYCELAINPCATHYEEECVEGCEFDDAVFAELEEVDKYKELWF